MSGSCVPGLQRREGSFSNCLDTRGIIGGAHRQDPASFLPLPLPPSLLLPFRLLRVARRTADCFLDAARCEPPSAPDKLPCRNVTDGCPKCDFDCHGRGECGTDGVCRCSPGWRGRFCEISNLQCPVGVLDKAGGCCRTGIVDRKGVCCESATPTLDRRAECCVSGKVLHL
jgi:hypothetical protein